MTEEEIKKFVIKTIKTGSKERIQAVLKRYREWIKENDKQSDIFGKAKKIFS